VATAHYRHCEFDLMEFPLSMLINSSDPWRFQSP
jgi:hypothetical protein